MALTSDTLAPRRGPPHRPPRPGLRRPPARRAGGPAALPAGDRPGRARADRLRERPHPHPRAAVPRPLGPYDRARAVRLAVGQRRGVRVLGPRGVAAPGRAPPAAALADGRRPRVGRDGHAWPRGSPDLLDQLLEAVRDAGPGHARRARAPRRRHQARQGRPPGTCGTGATPRRRSSGCSGAARCRPCGTPRPSAATTCSPERVLPAEVLAAPDAVATTTR